MGFVFSGIIFWLIIYLIAKSKKITWWQALRFSVAAVIKGIFGEIFGPLISYFKMKVAESEINSDD